jgi:hypothetical protein
MENYFVYLKDVKDGEVEIHEISSKHQTVKCTSFGEDLSVKNLKTELGENVLVFSCTYPNNDCESIKLNGISAIEHSDLNFGEIRSVKLCSVCHPNCEDHH